MIRLLMLAALACVCAPASAQEQAIGVSPTGQPASFDVRGEEYRATGYRSAVWGMTPAEVRGAVARDFPDAEIGTEVIDPVLGTTILVVAVSHLAPGPVPAAISYIFGARSKRLIHVNLDWEIATPTPPARASMTQAGAAIVADLSGYYWRLGSVARGVAVSPNALLLFAGTDEQGGAIEVRLQGIAYDLATAAGMVRSPAPSGSVLLHVGIAQAQGSLDIQTIEPGDF